MLRVVVTLNSDGRFVPLRSPTYEFLEGSRCENISECLGIMLIHYLLSNGLIKNVLLASQSNEAVNNATEGVLRLFRLGDAEPSLIRVGQEGQISETFKAYHSVKVEAHYREQFRAGLKERFQAAAKHIGLPHQFSDDLFLMESTGLAGPPTTTRSISIASSLRMGQ